jgi:FkbM family methyltransferase
MRSIKDTFNQFKNNEIDKWAFIEKMYSEHHVHIFDYVSHLGKTNIKSIEINDDGVVMTSRDRGIKIVCSEKDYRIAPIETLNFFDYEKNESDMMERLIGDGDTFFDIGANIGWYSINVATARRAAKIFAFEPIPKTYAQLNRNIQMNLLKNITTYNFGFSNRDDEFPFYYYPEGSGNASSANLTGRDDVEIVTCKVKTLDDFIVEANHCIDFIKCDVEGAELMVFQGGLKIIRRDLPVIFSEILRKWSAKFSYNPNEIFELFRKIGYEAYTVKGASLIRFNRMSEATIETNFFFLHSEKHIELVNKNS